MRQYDCLLLIVGVGQWVHKGLLPILSTFQNKKFFFFCFFFLKKGQHPDLRSLSLLSLADRWAFLMEAAREAVSGTQLCPQDGWPTAGARVKLAPGLPRTSPAPSSFIQTAVSAPHSGQAPEGGWQRYLLDKILGLPWGAEVLPLPLFHPLLLFQAPLLLGGSVDVPQPQVLGHLPPQVPGLHGPLLLQWPDLLGAHRQRGRVNDFGFSVVVGEF